MVLRLGGLHTEMSFLGAIGHLMGGSGLQELLEVIYADSAVSHILTDKAISRAIRGHILIEAVLYAIILLKIYGVPLPFKEKGDSRGDKTMEQVPDYNEPGEIDTSEENVTGLDQQTKKHMLEYAVEDVLEQATIGSEKHMLEYSVENVLEQTDIGSNLNSEVTGSDSVGQSAEAESVIRNITSGHMEVYEKQLIDGDNVDESLKLIPELLDKLMESETEIDNQEIDDQAISDFNTIEKLFDGLIKQEIDLESACANSVFQRVEDRLQMSKNDLARSRTARLWLLYLEMLSVLKQFIKAEREGNWDLHLHSMSRMLPFFAASGHNLYTKSVYIYLQNMENLSITHPNVHRLFQKGFHVIRRSDRHWAGLSTDLVIE